MDEVTIEITTETSDDVESESGGYMESPSQAAHQSSDTFAPNTEMERECGLYPDTFHSNSLTVLCKSEPVDDTDGQMIKLESVKHS